MCGIAKQHVLLATISGGNLWNVTLLFREQELETQLVQRGFANSTFSSKFRNPRIFTSSVICQLIEHIRVFGIRLDLKNAREAHVVVYY